MRIADEYVVEAVYSEEKALELLGPDVEVVLLQRRIPNPTGGEIRESDIDFQVAMVTAVDLADDVQFGDIEEYVTRPVSLEEPQPVDDDLVD